MIAPMTTGGRSYPYRIPCCFQNKNGFIALTSFVPSTKEDS